MRHQGRAICLRCKEHPEEVAYINVGREYTKHPSKVFVTTSEGVQLSFHDLVRLPQYLRIDTSAGTGGEPTRCRVCDSELTLFNPMLDFLESHREARDTLEDAARLQRLPVEVHVQPMPRKDFCDTCMCICGKRAPHKCSGCEAARYCSLKCQHEDWEEHKPFCRYFKSHFGVAKRLRSPLPITG